MRFRLLGSLEVVKEDGQSVWLRGQKARLLLVMLLNANQVVRVERLIDALWGERPPTTARQTVQYLVHALRKALGGSSGSGPLETHDGGYLLRVEPDALDLHRFEAALRRARQARAAGDLEAAAEALAAGLAEWRGPALADHAKEAFAQPVSARLEEQRVVAMEELAEAWLALGRHAELLGELGALSQSHPLRERVHWLLMLALYRSGRQAEALTIYRRFRDRLVDELGLEPGAELRRLEARILARDPTLAAPAPTRAATSGTSDISIASGAPNSPGASRTGTADVADAHAAAAPAASAVTQAPAGGAAAGAGATPAASAADGHAAPPAPAGAGGGQPAVAEERRRITVLALAVTLEEAPGDPEVALARSHAALESVLGKISRYGGTIVTVLGGTVLAVFGVPTAREDDPERAVRAALAVRHDPPDGVTIRAGVDTGEAIVAPRLGWGGVAGGTQVAVAGGVSGAVLGSATDLQARAAPGEVLVGGAAYRATRRRFVYAPAGDAWRPASATSRIGMVVDNPGTGRLPLVERRQELAFLTGILTRTRLERSTQLVTVIGAPGIGKTRLVAELGRQAEDDPELIAWRQGRSLPYGQHADAEANAGGVVFWALAEIVRAHTGITEADDPATAGAKLAGAVADLFTDPDEAELVGGQLRRLLGLDPAGEPAGEQRQVAFAAWARFLEAVADERPLVLVFEDLHWADEAMLDFLDQLAAQAGPVPLLVVCTARPELLSHRADWGGGKPNAATISLGPLSDSGAGELLDRLVAVEGVALTEQARATLLERAGGNPLFLEEYVRVLRDRGPGGEVPIPETVQQIITARIDRLDEPDRLLLRDLAVVGEPVTVEPLAALTPLPRERIVEALARLERHELLQRIRSTVNGQPAYLFRHALIQEVAYNQLLRADRAAKHRDLAGWLEANGGARQGDHTELLAHHYAQALALSADGPAEGLAGKARLAFRAAGERAAALGATATAARHYGRALDLWPTDDPDHAELLFRLGEARIYGEHTGEDVLVRARDALEAAGRLDRALEADVLLALAARSRNDGAAAKEHLDRALSRPTGPSPARAMALAARAVDLMILDHHDQAVEAGREALRMGEALGFPYAEGLALEAIGGARLKRGDPGGQADLERCIAVLQRWRNPAVHYCRFDLAWGLWWLGDLAGCARATEDGRREAERVGDAATRWFDAVRAGLDYAAGRWDEVVTAADRLLGGELSPQDAYLAPWYRILRARVRLARATAAGAGRAREDLDAAFDDVGVALDAAEIGHDIRYRQLAMALHGRLLLAAGRRDEAAVRLGLLLGEQQAEPERACATPDLAALVVDLGLPGDVLPGGLRPTRWHEAVRSFAARDFGKAAELYAAIGSTVDERDARARAAGVDAGLATR